MFNRLGAFRRLRTALGPGGFRFLEHSLGCITRLLPHTETTRWRVTDVAGKTRVRWGSNQRRELKLTLALKIQQANDFCLTARLTRRKAPQGAGSIARTLDNNEKNLCQRILSRTQQVLRGEGAASRPESLLAIMAVFDEQIVASLVQDRHELHLNVGEVFRALRELAEQSYENKALAFGCLLDPARGDEPGEREAFPGDILNLKRYRALSDGFRTAYRVSSYGRVIGFEDLEGYAKPSSHHFFPEWCEHLAGASVGDDCAMCLTRHGDILVFEKGDLRFSYRFGRWQYWNHSHIVDLLKNRARVQNVAPTRIARVVNAIYRAALDVSFRRCGGLFVLLRARRNLRQIVLAGDAIDDSGRYAIHRSFDGALPSRDIRLLPRSLVVELAGLDGALVLDNTGRLLAYGAVLRPRKRGRIGREEGSRTKAAIGASKYGIAIKVSSDGDITFLEAGRRFLEV